MGLNRVMQFIPLRLHSLPQEKHADHRSGFELLDSISKTPSFFQAAHGCKARGHRSRTFQSIRHQVTSCSSRSGCKGDEWFASPLKPETESMQGCFQVKADSHQGRPVFFEPDLLLQGVRYHLDSGSGNLEKS